MARGLLGLTPVPQRALISRLAGLALALALALGANASPEGPLSACLCTCAAFVLLTIGV